jgi:hypothetical protein
MAGDREPWGAPGKGGGRGDFPGGGSGRWRRAAGVEGDDGGEGGEHRRGGKWERAFGLLGHDLWRRWLLSSEGGGRACRTARWGLQEGGRLRCAHASQVAVSVEKDERAEAVEVGFLGARGVGQAVEGGAERPR